MTWASREPATEGEAPEVAPEVGPGGGAGAEGVARSPEAGALQVGACLVPPSNDKVHLVGGVGRADCPGMYTQRGLGQPAPGQGGSRWV